MDNEEAIDSGQQFGVALIPAINAVTSNLTDAEKVVWWSGFLCAIYGLAGAVMGGATLKAVDSAIKPFLEEVIAEHQH